MLLIDVKIPASPDVDAKGDHQVQMNLAGPMKIHDGDVGHEKLRKKVAPGAFEQPLSLDGGNWWTASGMFENKGEEGGVFEAEYQDNEEENFDLKG